MIKHFMFNIVIVFILGAGPTTAARWYSKGLRSIDDLKTRGNLNFQQAIGVKYYHEFLVSVHLSVHMYG